MQFLLLSTSVFLNKILTTCIKPKKKYGRLNKTKEIFPAKIFCQSSDLPAFRSPVVSFRPVANQLIYLMLLTLSVLFGNIGTQEEKQT